LEKNVNGLDLFSGIGGLTLALRDWVRPVAYCEIDPYCQGILLSRMAENNLPIAPIWDNVSTLSGDFFPSRVIDILYGGFPCQDISVAGCGKGLEGERSGLFFEIMRLAKEILPTFIFLENVPAITSRGGLRVVKEITTLGYDCRWCVISAASVGAVHKRERFFLLAHSHSSVSSRLSSGTSERQPSFGMFSEYRSVDEWQKTVSKVCRVTDGIPFRVDRIKSLGNSVVAAQAKEAFQILMGMKRA
jgi:DNA (cytosine-5)-methyltransferase 1